MAGLLDFLSSGYGGGLLSSLMYPSPILQQRDQPQTQYDQMGNPIFMPQSNKPDPFGTVPGFNPQDFVAKTPFNIGAGATPFAGPPALAAGPTSQPAPPQAPQPQPQPPAQGVDFPQNKIGVGGYQMPRIGDSSSFVPEQVNTQTNALPAQGFAPPQQAAMPTFLNNQGGISAGVRGFVNNLHNGPIGALIGGVGNALGAQDPAQQNLKAQYEALVPLVGPQKAMLAVMNPEAGKTILTEALTAKQQFKEIGVGPDGSKQYGFVNERDQSVRPYSAPGSNEPIQMQGPDGKTIQMPAGADANTWRKEITRINADVAAGKKTEVQAKAEIFGNKMELANKAITDEVGTSLAGKVASGVPLGNYLQSPAYQKFKQASSNFITALLRQESGAAISKTEFDRYDKEYMPQPGDSQEVLAQKAELRRVAIETMKKGAGPGYKSPSAAPLPAGWSVNVR